MNRRQMLGTTIAASTGLILPSTAISSEHLDIPQLILNDENEITNGEELKKHPLLRYCEEQTNFLIPVLLPLEMIFEDNSDSTFFNGSGILYTDDFADYARVEYWKKSNFVKIFGRTPPSILKFDESISIVCKNDDGVIEQQQIFDSNVIVKKLIAKHRYVKLDNLWTKHWCEEYLIENYKEFKNFNQEVCEVEGIIRDKINKQTSELRNQIKDIKEEKGIVVTKLREQVEKQIDDICEPKDKLIEQIETRINAIRETVFQNYEA